MMFLFVGVVAVSVLVKVMLRSNETVPSTWQEKPRYSPIYIVIALGLGLARACARMDRRY